MRFFLRALAYTFFALTCQLARAHGQMESTITLANSEEDFEVTAELTTASAALLLPSTEAADFSVLTFAAHHRSLLAAAPRLLSLTDSAGQPLAPARCLVSLNPQGEVRVTFLYPASIRPTRLRFDLLDLQPPGPFCLLSDQTSAPSKRVILLRETPVYVFETAPAP